MNQTNFTSTDLETLRNELSELVKTLPENTPSEVIAELNVIIYHLETYQEKIVKPIEERCDNVIVSNLNLYRL